MQTYLLDCLKDSLNKMPQLVYLKNVMDEVLDHFIIKDLNCIILSYFFKCIDCHNYFDELQISYCYCIDSEKNKFYRCTFCAQNKVHHGYCNVCSNSNNIIFRDEDCSMRPCKCIVSQCDNDAQYGSITQSLYCRVHASGVLVCRDRVCHNSCCNTGIYIDVFTYCELHKTPSAKLFLSEPKDVVEQKYIQKCYSCNKNCLIVHTCTCGKNRCNNCAYAEMFVVTTTESGISNIF